MESSSFFVSLYQFSKKDRNVFKKDRNKCEKDPELFLFARQLFQQRYNALYRETNQAKQKSLRTLLKERRLSQFDYLAITSLSIGSNSFYLSEQQDTSRR